VGLSPSADGARIPRNAEGVEGEEIREGVSLSPGGLGSVVSAPPAGSGAQPWPKMILVLSEHHRTPLIVMFVVI